jgi:hypothetical protein
MRLEIASQKAVKYACMNYHYAKRIPAGGNISYSVFNDNSEFCGVIIFGYPNNINILPSFNLKNGQVLELRRVALNSKQGPTSKALGIAMKLLKKACPLVKVLVSFSDKGQNHFGTIYQATNWYFISESESSGIEYLVNGKWVHSRHGKGTVKRMLSGKRKYIYPIDKTLIPLCISISKPYQKKEQPAQMG